MPKTYNALFDLWRGWRLGNEGHLLRCSRLMRLMPSKNAGHKGSGELSWLATLSVLPHPVAGRMKNFPHDSTERSPWSCLDRDVCAFFLR